MRETANAVSHRLFATSRSEMRINMLYPFMTLNDNTEIVHSEILNNNGKEQVKVFNL